MNKEQLNKISNCKSVDEVLELAKSNGKAITKEEAKKAFDLTHSNGELSDEEVSNVSGGVGPACQRNAYEDVDFDSEASVQFIFDIGQRVELYLDTTNDTTNVPIVGRRKMQNKETLKWYDVYDVQVLYYKKKYTKKNYRRSKFEK